MFKILVLICAAGLPHGDCRETTARVVQRLPMASSVQQCMFAGQAQIAPTMIGPKDGEYTKVICKSDDDRRAEK